MAIDPNRKTFRIVANDGPGAEVNIETWIWEVGRESGHRICEEL